MHCCTSCKHTNVLRLKTLPPWTSITCWHPWCSNIRTGCNPSWSCFQKFLPETTGAFWLFPALSTLRDVVVFPYSKQNLYSFWYKSQLSCLVIWNLIMNIQKMYNRNEGKSNQLICGTLQRISCILINPEEFK